MNWFIILHFNAIGAAAVLRRLLLLPGWMRFLPEARQRLQEVPMQDVIARAHNHLGLVGVNHLSTTASASAACAEGLRARQSLFLFQFTSLALWGQTVGIAYCLISGAGFKFSGKVVFWPYSYPCTLLWRPWSFHPWGKKEPGSCDFNRLVELDSKKMKRRLHIKVARICINGKNLRKGNLWWIISYGKWNSLVSELSYLLWKKQKWGNRISQ